MTVENTNSRRKTYDGNGSTTDFPITFDYVDDDTINVVHIDADDVETEWVLDGAGDTGFTIVSGEVVANTAPATDETLIIYRETDYTQERDLKNNRRTSDEVLEAAYDKLTHLAQELSETSDRALQFDITYTGDIVDAGDYMDLMVAHEAAAAVSAA
ncbi:hypothetical protein KAR91_11920, partial [Candidatus Pacearchaeota archaeon]|nr:hypothetical protein [Candidatus Pacearchaeota archaeon]